MRAWTFTSRGLPSQVLKLRHDLPQPQPTDLKQDEVLVKVLFSSIEQSHVSLMTVLPHFNSNLWIPGFEFSGIVVASGETVTGERLPMGQEVFGMIHPNRFMRYNGVLAEYIVLPRDCMVPKPSNVRFEQASGIVGGGCTVIGLAERTGLMRVNSVEGEYQIYSTAVGKNILITGGSTGLGFAMLQLAKTLVGPTGRVVTTCSPRNVEIVRSYGADDTIDYTRYPDLHKYLTQHYSSDLFYAIIDIAGSDPLLHHYSPAYLEPTGSFAFAGNIPVVHRPAGPGLLGPLSWIINTVRVVLFWQSSSLRPVMLGGVPRRSFFHSGDTGVRNLGVLRSLVEEGTMTAVVDSVWGMEDILKAFDRLASGKVSGKVVIKVQD